MSLSSILQSIREKPSVSNPNSYIAAWSEPEAMEGKKVKAFVLILRTKGCGWAWESGGCSMCGYVNDCSADVEKKNLEKQMEKALKEYAGEPYVKIFTSGSFLDRNEITAPAAEMILSAFPDAERVLIESRPEFITAENIRPLKSLVKNLEIAVGLESANDTVLLRSINKGFTFRDYLKSIEVVKGEGLISRTYLLLKPPFLTEKEAMLDAIESIRKIDGITETISINPMNIQKRTLVERLWKHGSYRGPWLWTLLEVLKTPAKSRLISSPTAGGSVRGVHNCGKCDAEILKRIEEFSLTQERSLLEMECECRGKWAEYMEAEPFLQSACDMERLVKSTTEQSF